MSRGKSPRDTNSKTTNTMKTQNVEIHVKLKSDSILVQTSIQRSDCGGLFIGEDWYEREEFDYNETEERLYSKDGSLQIQF
jgi:hypothetical protein